MEIQKPLLSVCNLSFFYGDIPALKQVNITVCTGQIVSIVGPNGAGKTTLMKSICGMLRPVQGIISFEQQQIQKLPVHEIVRCGLVYVPEGMKQSTIKNLQRIAYTGFYLRPSVMIGILRDVSTPRQFFYLVRRFFDALS